MANKYYKISERQLKNGTKNIITIDDSVKPTEQDMKDIKLYIQCGYELRHKSEKRAAAARKRAKETGFGKKKKTTEPKA